MHQQFRAVELFRFALCPKLPFTSSSVPCCLSHPTFWFGSSECLNAVPAAFYIYVLFRVIGVTDGCVKADIFPLCFLFLNFLGLRIYLWVNYMLECTFETVVVGTRIRVPKWAVSSLIKIKNEHLFPPPPSIFSPADSLSLLKNTELMTAHGVQMYAAEGSAMLSYIDADWTVPSALVVGAEAEGLGSDTRRGLEGGQVVGVRIPLVADVESLNAAVAGAIVLGEAQRQRAVAQQGLGAGSREGGMVATSDSGESTSAP